MGKRNCLLISLLFRCNFDVIRGSQAAKLVLGSLTLNQGGALPSFKSDSYPPIGSMYTLQRRSQQFVVYNCMVTRNSVDVLFFTHHLQWVIHRP